MNHLGALQLTKDTQKSGTPGDILRASYPFERSLLAKILRFRGGVRKIKMARLGRHGGPTFGGTNRFSNHHILCPTLQSTPTPALSRLLAPLALHCYHPNFLLTPSLSLCSTSTNNTPTSCCGLSTPSH
jgi:hypothetical protein